MSRPTTFLARDTYRRRRLIDALRILPVLGALLFLVPMLGAGQTERSTALAGLYLFGVWVALIVTAAAFVRWLARAPGGAGVDPLDTSSSDVDVDRDG